MREPSLRMTVISSASAMTWLLVTTMPAESMMKPDPSEFTRRGVLLPPRFWLSPCWPRRLKKSRNNSSSCGSLGRFGIGPTVPWLRDVTFCDVEMLTTASITLSATSAMPSGPRALAGAESGGRIRTDSAMAAKAGRRTCRVYRTSVPSMEVCAPQGKLIPDSAPVRAWTQEFTRQERNALENRAESGPSHCGERSLSPHQPDHQHPEHGAHDAGDSQRCLRRFKCSRCEPFCRPWRRRENEPLDGKHQADCHEEIQHRRQL